MTSVAHLRRSSTAHLAAASGSPRPVIPSSLRTADAGTAAVIHLYPAPTTPMAPATPDDEETALRISGIARSVAQGALEVLAGSRPLQQMSRWLDPENYERLQLRANLVRCISGPSGTSAGGGEQRITHRHVVVRSARICAVREGVYEASVVAFDQKRVRAVALRIERRRGSWRVTALEIG